ncbi:MAG: hypothetical protein O6940_14600 [Ignavibacteria bacterium]|nr:hypothetical protein [Ignavibacteria bacterium]
MKSTVLLLLFVFAIFISVGMSVEPAKQVKTFNKDLATKNLLIGLESKNNGLISSSAFYLGEYNSTQAVIPLMKILKNSGVEELRISAALALLKIGDARGIYAIKRAIKFDESKRVSNMCSKFYNAYVSQKYSTDS